MAARVMPSGTRGSNYKKPGIFVGRDRFTAKFLMGGIETRRRRGRGEGRGGKGFTAKARRSLRDAKVFDGGSKRGGKRWTAKVLQHLNKFIPLI